VFLAALPVMALLPVLGSRVLPEYRDRVEVRAQRCESRQSRLQPVQVSSDGFDESDRSQPAYQKVLEMHPGGGVGSRQRCPLHG